jgi:predicted nucleotidyltransferase
MTRLELLKILGRYKEKNAEKYGIDRLGIFGPFSRNQAMDVSDVDILTQIFGATQKVINRFGPIKTVSTYRSDCV